MKLLLLGLGALLFVVGLAVSLLEWSSGAQPWGQLLGDNFWFARTLPFTIGLGIVLGYWKAASDTWGTPRRADGAFRRFAQSTVWLHALAGLAVVGLIFTGGWQYMKGLLDAETPVYMGTVYRVHYIAASVLIMTTAAFLTDWFMRGERGLTPAKGQMIRALRGLAHELPRPIGTLLAYGLGLNLKRAAPPTEQFTWYERLISFPLWELSIGLVMLTGIVKAIRYIYPIPGDVLYWVSAIHVGAGVLLAMKLLDHLRYVLAPSRWPLMASMWTGWIPARYVERFLPRLVRRADLNLECRAGYRAVVTDARDWHKLRRRCLVKYVWILLALLYAALNIYSGYLLFTAGIGAKLSQKGIYLQAPPILGGLALAVLALPLIWNAFRLATSRTPQV